MNSLFNIKYVIHIYLPLGEDRISISVRILEILGEGFINLIATFFYRKESGVKKLPS
jgi:hypothetical protein